ncbi:MAG: hypothetical protein JNK12_16965 [Acidimicrobiales bacterium]|nr:hypothetical protein [Acidimicrobiales bacterium]
MAGHRAADDHGSDTDDDGLTDGQRATHLAAVRAGEPGYFDPDSGLFVLTAITLAARERCCGEGCRHCPYPV